ncbi:MAG: diguanylate cyclase [Sulfurimonas sp.]|nr:diguanylate cyclase [Sulfurimonas sp.]MBU1217395.1 diguanylate cyclase [bacterium]MBU1433928.1 diguanylate cyclase [bacterium]MBU1503626.1 diguanylate cyclase [bacterium]MBU4025034.1 diguanylate cyclase [bacterium]
MTIQTIINKSLKRVELEGKLLTPDFYAEAFCIEANKAGMMVEDCHQVSKLSATLNKELQKELTQYRVKTMSEFARFLISKLNRMNPTTCSAMLESQNNLIKRVLQVVSVLHNREASELARKSIDMLSSTTSPVQIDQYRQLWVNFITTYDDSFLQKLKQFTDVDTTDLAKTISNINSEISVATGDNKVFDLTKISMLLVSSLVPSIASSVNDEIANLSEKIRTNPSLLESASIENEIRTAISLRIALDKKSVKEMIESLDGVLDKLSLRLIDIIESADSSNIEIKKIKKELESYNEESEVNFSSAHKKLYTIAVALEQNTQLLSIDLKKHSQEVELLGNKISKLEQELESVRQESKEDFLTKLYNKRALDEFFTMKDAEYERYGRNYSVVMFDLDHFKSVNDMYGHEAGDAVLTAFAAILKQEARSVDIVGRYGGEEFIAILSETDTQGGVVFAEKVRKYVQKARFMYKGKRIEVTVSSGVSERKKHVSLKALINSADEYLYKAKKDGRNRVAYK